MTLLAVTFTLLGFVVFADAFVPHSSSLVLRFHSKRPASPRPLLQQQQHQQQQQQRQHSAEDAARLWEFDDRASEKAEEWTRDEVKEASILVDEIQHKQGEADGQGQGVADGGEVEDADASVGYIRDLDEILMERAIRYYDPRESHIKRREKCFLVGLEMKRQPGSRSSDGSSQEDEFTLEESLGELSELAGTAGLEVVGSTYQRVAKPNAKTFIGPGKVNEIRRSMQALGCKTAIIDAELTPAQQKNLEEAFGGIPGGIKVLDRTALILDIFAQHARTREGKLQVELALAQYRLPRLTRLWTHLERQVGGKGGEGSVGLRGPGESQIETDRRLLYDQILTLQKRLDKVKQHREMHRKRRKKLGMPVIALVGYTNTGKSTILNALTRAGVLAEPMLFATLDPTTRKIRLPGSSIHPEVLVTDTVGFIQKLPTTLVASFRATLEEVREADVIVHMVDKSNPLNDKQQRAVLGVLHELECDDKPIVTVWNKIDLLDDPGQVQIDAALAGCVAVSAKTAMGMEDVTAALGDALEKLLQPIEVDIPYAEGQLVSKVFELGTVDFVEYREGSTYLSAKVPVDLLGRLEPYLVQEDDTQQQQEDGAGEPTKPESREREVDWNAIAKRRHRVRDRTHELIWGENSQHQEQQQEEQPTPKTPVAAPAAVQASSNSRPHVKPHVPPSPSPAALQPPAVTMSTTPMQPQLLHGGHLSLSPPAEAEDLHYHQLKEQMEHDALQLWLEMTHTGS
ncbi:unnamed protein product [Vitrella brassicaformis CCMP3155]|uniref:Hflx-type G domain-containing protein n=2 Tax=Vitrella brassicaformis TaxID=1169539 RepID=A0A0G4F628_VITBC|nr:unnamed protein product [Vitrella brassicaformis CCMP3155]|eukprot:CEM07548.1 unnamed protein product [Vitrella brassicaformis CCMP3155]